MPPHPERNQTILRARALRRDMTLPEGILWRVLRERPNGFKFRRQHPFGRCILDFYCPAAKLVIEVDGEAHRMGNLALRDIRRDAWLTGQGLRILRIAASDVMSDRHSVITAITSACAG
jgi:very-short-patch-repair endonuclease